MKTANADILDAFIQALAQQQAPLPEEIRQAMPQIGRDLAQHNPEAIGQLHQLIERYPPLQQAFNAAYRQLLVRYGSQERTKSLSETVAASWRTDLEIIAIQALTAIDPIATAKQYVKQLKIASSSSTNVNAILEKGNRLFAMAAGGAFVGGALAQTPGAIIGAILAALFGWFVPIKPGSGRLL